MECVNGKMASLLVHGEHERSIWVGECQANDESRLLYIKH